MKKKFVLFSLIVAFVFPTFGEATSVSGQEIVPVVQEVGISPRAVFTYIFPSVPPKTFNGRTRIYYEYRAKDKVYIGYYQ